MATTRFRPLGVIVVCAAMLVSPLAWRLALAWWAPAAHVSRSYLPALETTRRRGPFVSTPLQDLMTLGRGYVLIGDSMGGRIEPERFSELTGAWSTVLLQNATGPAYWFLAFKNYVIASGAAPRLVIFFFRDTELTDTTFRLTGPYREKLDEVALAREDELNRLVAARMHGAWSTVHQLASQAYDLDRARDWVEPLTTTWPARVVVGTGRRQAFLDALNTSFGLDRLRPIAQADIAAAEDRNADFAANLPTSVLPLILSMGKAHGLPVCFVRVLRRPVDGAPPPESPALQQYVAALRAFLTAEGAIYLDDRDDPAMASIAYGDGDHIAREERRHYTELFVPKLKAHGR